MSSLLKKKRSPFKPNRMLESKKNILLKIRMQVSSYTWGLCEIFTSLQLKSGPEKEPVLVVTTAECFEDTILCPRLPKSGNCVHSR